MHPQLFDMIRYGKRAGIRMETSTNITLLDEERGRQVLDAGLDVLYLAMDGATKETYERVRVNAKWDRVLRNVDRFLERKARTGATTRVVMQIIAMNETRDDIEAFLARWQRPEVEQVNVKHLDTWGDQVEAITEHRTDAEPLALRRRPCPTPWCHAAVFWAGTRAWWERD